jgi:hypothetical protein
MQNKTPGMMAFSLAALRNRRRFPFADGDRIVGQATFETLFIMFMMFMLIAAIYQMFLIHNTIYQMSANAYYKAFKDARDKNSKDNDFTTEISGPLRLTNGVAGGDPQTIPRIALFAGGGPLRVNTQYWIGSGTKGSLLPDFSSAGTGRAHQQAKAPPCSGSCGCTVVDGDGNSHTMGETQYGYIMSNPLSQPPFPHSVRPGPDFPATPQCPLGSPYCTTPTCN